MATGLTTYSKEIPGSRGNYDWPVRFDLSDSGYLGISQEQQGGAGDRVLLSPKQVKALLEFVQRGK